ncbi:MAG: anthranilate synthase component I family protein, partial [Bacteroidota bacterium]
DRFSNSFLLESSDYHGTENAFSYICCMPIAFLQIENKQVKKKLPNQEVIESPLTDLKKEVSAFTDSFELAESNKSFIKSGLFGYFNYDVIGEFGDVHLRQEDNELPITQYHLFKFIIALDHAKNECHIIEGFEKEKDDVLFEEVISLIQQRNIPDYPFSTTGDQHSSKTDDEYLKMVEKGIHHCHIGDVFQVVLSRSFKIPYQGDDFQVYRALRSVNPSPYLFYFDYGSFRIFGSSPEAQIVLKDGQAEIHPIAGTFRRTGDDEADKKLALELIKDPKEDSEHVMLVDLARNDLSHSCTNVEVKTYKEVQYYSHVIHLVSKVVGEIKEGTSFMDIVAQTFPAGTLSGAPKIRAMQIIEENENAPRGFYGGAVGFMDFAGNFNHAIMIRSFFSKNNVLKFQAGAGIVAQSTPANELQEVYNKVSALQAAVAGAERI